MSFLGFDVNKYVSSAEERSFTPVPRGKYNAEITEIGNYTSKAGNLMIKAVFDITGPSHQGRKLFEYFNTNNEGKGGEIAKQRLTALLKAANSLNASGFEQIKTKKVTLMLIVEDDRNRIVAFEPVKEQVHDETPW